MIPNKPLRWRKLKKRSSWYLERGRDATRIRICLGPVGEAEAVRALTAMQAAEDAGPFAPIKSDTIIALARWDRARATAILLGRVRPDQVANVEVDLPPDLPPPPAPKPAKPARKRRRVRLTPDAEGWIYFVGADEGPIKIGFTTQTVSKRLDVLQVGLPEAMREYGAIPGTLAEEQALHRALEPFRVRGEWFERGPALGALAALHVFTGTEET